MLVVLLPIPPPTVITLVVVMVLRNVELVGQPGMSGGQAVAVTTWVRVVVDSDTGVKDKLDELDVTPAPERVEPGLLAIDVVVEGAMGPVRVLNVERELVGSVSVAIDVVAGGVYPPNRLMFAHW